MKWFLILLLENERYVHLFDWIRRLRRSVGRSLLDFLISNIPRHVYSTKKVYCTSRLDGVSILVGRPVGRHPELPTNTLLALGARTRGGALCVELLADRWTTRRDFSFLTGVAKGRPSLSCPSRAPEPAGVGATNSSCTNADYTSFVKDGGESRCGLVPRSFRLVLLEHRA